MSATSDTMMGTFGMTDFLMPLVLEDLNDDQARRRSRDTEGPSITWLVGHMLHYRYWVLNMLGDERESPYGEMFTADATEGGDYPEIASLADQWEALAPAFHEALTSKTDADWDGPGAGEHNEKSLRDQIVFFAWHEGYHMGAIGQMRKEMGLMGPAERVMALREAEATGEAEE